MIKLLNTTITSHACLLGVCERKCLGLIFLNKFQVYNTGGRCLGTAGCRGPRRKSGPSFFFSMSYVSFICVVVLSGLIWEQFNCNSLNLYMLLNISTVKTSGCFGKTLISCVEFGVSHVSVHPQMV